VGSTPTARPLTFVTAMLRTHEVPQRPLVLYAVGTVPIALRALVPETVLGLVIAVLGVGLAWLGLTLPPIRPHHHLGTH
jgi:hypothetical protein